MKGEGENLRGGVLCKPGEQIQEAPPGWAEKSLGRVTPRKGVALEPPQSAASPGPWERELGLPPLQNPAPPSEPS